VKAVCTLQRAEPWTRMIATEGPVPILQWLESQATQFVKANVRSRWAETCDPWRHCRLHEFA